MRVLTPKQARFAEEYLIDLNATQAAIRAGYSERTAKSVGHETLTIPDVASAIQAAQDARSVATGVTADIVVRGLLMEAQREGDDASHGARVQAWTTLARHLGMLNDKLTVGLSDDLLDRIEAARARVRPLRHG
ncbi:MAG: hypothetical protein ABS99_05725 [Acetobacteraceae bacterium SCN 69-10]|mgnify:CR=1 FL=1|nr:terminase small subunit [Rhodospirillales bacterium]ODU56594.1 MAG: hypothetical protein ABS99_05725 [Acetobacteraceae bacterium SCN 69-10]OJY67267.1 MAG: hypothetical protein BGP12_14060 [Rhodospirillales bacterium 70-18]